MIGLGSKFGRWILVCVMAATSLLACGGRGGDAPSNQADQAAPSQPLSAEAQALVAQGNEAQRDGRYADARDLFGQAMEIHPNHPVPQFGSLLAAMALGDTAMVASLREKLAVTGPDLLAMVSPGGGMGSVAPGAEHIPPGAMPPGHPVVQSQPRDTLPSRPGGNG